MSHDEQIIYVFYRLQCTRQSHVFAVELVPQKTPVDGATSNKWAKPMGDFISQFQAMFVRWRQASPGLEGSR